MKKNNIIKPSTFIAYAFSIQRVWETERAKVEKERANEQTRESEPFHKIEFRTVKMALQKGNFAFYVIKCEFGETEFGFTWLHTYIHTKFTWISPLASFTINFICAAHLQMQRYSHLFFILDWRTATINLSSILQAEK